MELFSLHPEIPYGIIVVLMFFVSLLFKRELNKMDKSIDELKISDSKLSDEIKEIKGNYLDRFTGVIQTMNENHTETLEALSEIKQAVAAQSATCKIIQDMKKK